MTIKDFRLAALMITAVFMAGCASSSAPTSATPAPAAATERTVEKEQVVVSDSSSETAKSEMTKEEKVAKAVDSHNEAVEDDDDRIVCRKYKKTGSHFSRTRCVTVKQMKQESEAAQDAIQRASRGSNVGPDN